MRFVKPAVLRPLFKRLQRCLEQIRSNTVFVEGQRDKRALQRLGAEKVYTIAGNLALSCARVAAQGVARVVVLTDFDRRGTELLARACAELERYGIRYDVETRRDFARTLRIKYFEDLDRAYEVFMNEYAQGLTGSKPVKQRGVIYG